MTQVNLMDIGLKAEQQETKVLSTVKTKKYYDIGGRTVDERTDVIKNPTALIFNQT